MVTFAPSAWPPAPSSLEAAEPRFDISIVVPMYNEEESIEPMYRAITGTLASINLKAEIIFVDDGSKDNTFKRAKELAAQDDRLRVIKFRKNYGQTPAMAAGIDHARGEVLITMDGDLQNDPRDIQAFLEQIALGYDIVCGIRQKRQDKLISRKIPSKIANWLIGKVTGVPIKDNGCSLKAYRAVLIKKVPLYSEMHRFIPAMASLAGAQVTQIPVRHHARQFGQSKYGLSRTYRVLLDLLTIKTIVAYVARPLYWFSLMSLLAFGLSALAFFAGVVELWQDPSHPKVVMLGLSQIFAMLGISLVFSGVLCEMIYKFGDLKIEALSKIRAQRFGFDKEVKHGG